MRIAILGPVYPYRGGIAHYTAALTRALIEREHRVSVFNFTRQYPRLLFPGRTQTDTSRAPLDVPSERCLDSLNPLTWRRTARRIAHFAPDLLVVQWWHPFFAPAFGSVARRLRRTAKPITVFLCHNVRPHEASRLDDALLRYAYGAADAFLLQAHGETGALHRLLPGDSRPTAVAAHPPYDALAALSTRIPKDEARARLELTDPRVALFFGLVRPYKGLEVLLDALAELHDDGLSLLVAGELYTPLGPIRDQIARLGLDARVRLENRYIPNEEVATYFSAADVVVLPYRHATQSGIVQLAWAYGAPVIVSAVGGIPEVVEHDRSGLLVPPDNPVALAAALRRFFADNLGTTLAEGARLAAAERGWGDVCLALESLHHAVGR